MTVLIKGVAATGWYFLPTIILSGLALLTQFPMMLFMVIPFQTSWIASVGLVIAKRIAPIELAQVLEQNVLNVDYVIEQIS